MLVSFGLTAFLCTSGHQRCHHLHGEGFCLFFFSKSCMNTLSYSCCFFCSSSIVLGHLPPVYSNMTVWFLMPYLSLYASHEHESLLNLPIRPTPPSTPVTIPAISPPDRSFPELPWGVVVVLLVLSLVSGVLLLVSVVLSPVSGVLSPVSAVLSLVSAVLLLTSGELPLASAVLLLISGGLSLVAGVLADSLAGVLISSLGPSSIGALATNQNAA